MVENAILEFSTGKLGTADESVIGVYKDLGFDGYLLKPITREKLHQILG